MSVQYKVEWIVKAFWPEEEYEDYYEDQELHAVLVGQVAAYIAANEYVDPVDGYIDEELVRVLYDFGRYSKFEES